MAPGRHAAQDLAASSAKRPVRLRHCRRTGPIHLVLDLDQRLARDVDGEHAKPTDQGTRPSSMCLTIAQAPPAVCWTQPSTSTASWDCGRCRRTLRHRRPPASRWIRSPRARSRGHTLHPPLAIRCVAGSSPPPTPPALSARQQRRSKKPACRRLWYRSHRHRSH
jgi:hypothetical protein